MSISIEGPPQRLEPEYATIFTKNALKFLCDLVARFEQKVEHVMLQRERRRLDILEGKWRPSVQSSGGGNWTITEIPERIRNRKLDLGDVSPANTALFIDALFADVQGVQVRREEREINQLFVRIAYSNNVFNQLFVCVLLDMPIMVSRYRYIRTIIFNA